MAPADPGFVAQLATDLRAELEAFVGRRAGHLVEPEDIVQQATLRALKSADSLREPSRGRAWFYRIVRNALADELRKVGVPAAAADVPDQPQDAGEACRCALSLTDRLKPEYQAMLRRVVVDEVPVTVLAGEMGLTPGNAMVRLHRARQALRTLLAEHCGTTSLRECLGCICDERGCCALG